MFNQVVDEIILRSNRLDMKKTIIGIVNGVIRRIQSKQYFQSDLKEYKITPEATDVEFSAGQWKWRRNPDVRLISSVRYDPWDVYPPNQQPSVNQESLINYWYKVGDHYVFRWSKYEEDPESISISYYTTSKEFEYTEEDERLVKYDYTNNTWYERKTAKDAWKPLTKEEATSKEEELSKYGNWLLRDYKEIVISGSLSKLFGLLNDEERAKREFAEFNDLFKTLTNNERYANFAY